MFSETWNSAELGILICKSRVGKEKNHVENDIFSKTCFRNQTLMSSSGSEDLWLSVVTKLEAEDAGGENEQTR